MCKPGKEPLKNMTVLSRAGTNMEPRHHLLGSSRPTGCPLPVAAEGRVADGTSSSSEFWCRQGWWPGPLFRTGPASGSSYRTNAFPEKGIHW